MAADVEINPMTNILIESKLRELAQKNPVNLMDEAMRFLNGSITKECAGETSYLLRNRKTEWGLRGILF